MSNQNVVRNWSLMILVFLLISHLTTHAQPKPKNIYYRIRLQDPHDPALAQKNPESIQGYCTCIDGLENLEKNGLVLDHGEWKKGQYFITEVNEEELQLLKKLKVPYDVLVRDLSRYYVERNQTSKHPLADSLKSLEILTQANTTTANCIIANLPAVEYGTMGGYFRYEELQTKLRELQVKYPQLITSQTPVSQQYGTQGGRMLYYVRVSNEASVEHVSRPRVLYTALHHAREPMSMMQLVYFVRYLLLNYGYDNVVTDILNNMELYFITCANPDGYLYNEQQNPNGGGLWRKNRKLNSNGTYGVDLNRNYGYQWGYDNIGSSGTTTSDTYRGTGSFSESETRAIRDFMNQFKFNLAINHHSYSNLVIEPFSYIPNYVPAEDSAILSQHIQTLSQCNNFRSGTNYSVLGYTANGDAIDWMYAERNSKPKTYAYTVETGSSTDGFWPAIDRISPLCVGNIDLNLQAALLVRNSAPLSLQKGYSANPLENGSAINSSFYPNPATTYARLIIPSTFYKSLQPITLLVFDVLGKPIVQYSVTSGQRIIEWNTTNLQPGVYFYQIYSGSQHTVTQKLIVARK